MCIYIHIGKYICPSSIRDGEGIIAFWLRYPAGLDRPDAKAEVYEKVRRKSVCSNDGSPYASSEGNHGPCASPLPSESAFNRPGACASLLANRLSAQRYDRIAACIQLEYICIHVLCSKKI